MNLARRDRSAVGLPKGSGSTGHGQARAEGEGGIDRTSSVKTRLKNRGRDLIRSLARAGERSASQKEQHEPVDNSGVEASSASKVLEGQPHTSDSPLDSGNDMPLTSHVSDRMPKDSRSLPESCLELAIKWMNVHCPDYNIPSGVNEKEMQEKIHSQIQNLEIGQTRTKNVVENTVRNILLFRGLANSITLFDPTKGSRVAVNGLFGILETILQAATLDEQKIQDIYTVASKLAYWADIEKLYLATQQPRVASHLEALQASIVELYKKFLKLEVIVPSKERNRVSGILNHIGHVAKAPMEAPDWNKLICGFKVSQSDCETKLSALKDSIGKRKDILEWLSVADPLSEHEKILQRTQVSNRYQHSGEWLLKTQDYKKWASKTYSKEHSVLWLRVGTGKTTLLARVIQSHLEESSQFPEHRFAYAYCSRAQSLDSKTSHIAVLNSLLRQASFNQLTGECPSNIVALFNDRSQGGKATPLEVESQILDQLITILLSGIRLRVMIDALDECDRPDLLLEALAKVYTNAPEKLEILMTSRHEVRVEEIDAFKECWDLDLNTSLTYADMKNFIDLEVRGAAKYSRLLKGERPDLEEKLIEVLDEKAGGMFRWVQLQLSLFLDPKKSLNHPKDVEKKLNELKTGSKAGEKELNQAYADIFERNTPKGDIEKGHAIKLYKLLLCCKERLTAVALAEAVAFDENIAESCMNEELLGKMLVDTTFTPAYILGLCRDFVVKFKDGTLDIAVAFDENTAESCMNKELLDKKLVDTTVIPAHILELCRDFVVKFKDGTLDIAVAFDENTAESCMNKELLNKKLMDTTVTPAYILGLCRDFVVEFEDGTLDFAHISVKDYFQSLPQDQYSIAQCTQQMAKLCLIYFITIKEKVIFNGGEYMGNFMSYAFKRLGEHCSELNQAMRTESRISKILIDWMVFAEGRVPFTEFVNLVQAAPWEPTRLWQGEVLSGSNSAIFAACAWNLVEVVQQFPITEPEFINLRNGRNSTPLFVACTLGSKETVKLLLDLTSADVEDIGGWWCGQRSALHGVTDPAVAELLLTKHPDLVHSVDSFGQTPLFYATNVEGEGGVSLIKLYLDYHADINATNNYGETTLHYAAGRYAPNLEAIRLLLARKADANARDKKGRTPLHVTAESGTLPAIRLLTDAGATIDLADKRSMTPLLYAVSRRTYNDDNVGIIEHLLGLGASILSTNNHKQGVLHLARDLQVIEYLLRVFQQGHSTPVTRQLEATDDKGDTPLLVAARATKPLDKLMALIEAGADPNARDNAGQSNLHLLMANGFFEEHRYKLREAGLEFAVAVQALVSRGCNINQKDNIGNEPIHCIFGTEATIDQIIYAKCKLACLIEAGVSITCPDGEGKTLIDHFLSYLKCQDYFSYRKRQRKMSLDYLDIDYLDRAYLDRDQFGFLVLRFLPFLEHCLELQRNTVLSTATLSAMEEIRQIVQRLKVEELEPARLFAYNIRKSIENEKYNKTILNGEGELKPVVFSWSDSLEWPSNWPRYKDHVL